MAVQPHPDTPFTGEMEVLQNPEELASLIEVYRELAPRRVVEIGTWDGGTLREWLTQGEPDVVVAVDLEHRNPGAYAEWRGEATDLVVVTGSTWDESTWDEIAPHGPFDFAFVDGDHGDFGVRCDWSFLRPLMAEGAVAAFHDISAPIDYPGPYPPAKLVNELEAEGLRVERFQQGGTSPWAQGIGVVWL